MLKEIEIVHLRTFIGWLTFLQLNFHPRTAETISLHFQSNVSFLNILDSSFSVIITQISNLSGSSWLRLNIADLKSTHGCQ